MLLRIPVYSCCHPFLGCTEMIHKTTVLLQGLLRLVRFTFIMLQYLCFLLLLYVIFIFLRFSPEKGIAVFHVMSHGFALIWLEVEFASNFKNLFLGISLCSEPLIWTRLTHQLRFECPCDVADFISIHGRGHQGHENSGKELRQLMTGGFQSQPRAAWPQSQSLSDLFPSERNIEEERKCSTCEFLS